MALSNAELERRVSQLEILVRQLQSRSHEGTGSPENVVAAPPGTVYRNLSGGAVTTLYVKESGASTATGWTAK